MNMRAHLVLLSLSALPACYALNRVGEECEPSPCPGAEVEWCEESADCDEVPWCGTTVFCESAPTPPVCGPAECPEGETLSEIRCSPDEAGCTALTGCHVGVYCRAEDNCSDEPMFDPCEGATSSTWASGRGSCFNAPTLPKTICLETWLYCGGPYYCFMTCPTGALEASHPSECPSPDDCTEGAPGPGLPPSWCYNNRRHRPCADRPICELWGREGVEIPLDEECGEDSYCEFRSRCFSTIQCRF